jgi:hypothetical protein
MSLLASLAINITLLRSAMGNLFNKVSPLSPKFLCRLHPHRHARPATPCHNPLLAPPHSTLPLTSQSGRKLYVFSGFGVIRFSLLRIYAPWSLTVIDRLSSIRSKLTLSSSPSPFPLPPSPVPFPKREQSSIVHIRTSPMRVTYIALNLKHTFLSLRSLPTYVLCLCLFPQNICERFLLTTSA